MWVYWADRRRQMSLAFIWGLALIVNGCGSPGTSPKAPVYKGETVPVSGTVTLDGEPLPDAMVTFTFDGNAPSGFISAGGKTDSSGKYVARAVGGGTGTPPGRYKVSISCLVMKDGSSFHEDPENGMDAEQLKMAGALQEKVPAKYTDPKKTPLNVEITQNQDDKSNFSLKSK